MKSFQLFLPSSLIVWRFFVQGYFILLLKSIEANLRAWNISLLTAPVDPEMAQIWSEKLGFTILSAEEVTTLSVAYSYVSLNGEVIWLNFWTKTNRILQILSFVLLIRTVLRSLVVLLTGGVNAGVATPGDVQEPSLGAEITCLSKSNLCLLILLQKWKPSL